ncbi:serine-rich adhesin for platelets [Colossoma macropomum]|uniref:serine-rich adhesin for platelets n=1 Tax=Colossoma macropomum TaxID=42526 RepID=UPI001863D132|nr:serine-rich adhesin for platelets [Colossoma macropomum]
MPESTTVETALMSSLPTTASGTASSSANSVHPTDVGSSMPESTTAETTLMSSLPTTASGTASSSANSAGMHETSPSANTIQMSGSAMVQSRLVFSPSTPIPSESLVLSTIRTLINSRLSNLSDLVKVLTFTFQKDLNTSYAVIFTISLSNISLPGSTDLRNNTYIEVQTSINKVLNMLLNDPDAEPFEPKRSVFITSGKRIEGSMEYSFQDEDTKQPHSFLSELKIPRAASTTISPTTTTSLLLTSPTTSSKISGLAVVYSRLVFNSSSLVPSESFIISATRTLLSSRLTNLNDSTKVLNITYEKKTDTSYALLFTFSLSDISMPESADLRNKTYIQVKNSINKALNTLLNDRNAEPFEPRSSVFTTSANQVEGSMEYSFQEGDTKQPVSFLNELKMQSAVSTTVSPATSTNLLLTSPTISSKMSGSAVVNSKLVFNSSSPVPSESLVLHAARTLLSSRLTNLSDSTKVLNITYEKKTDTSYALLFTFSLSNISMPESADLRNNTYVQVQNSINKALNTLLNDRNAEPFEPKSSVFTTSANQVEGSMEYSFQEGDTKQPVSFLNELKMQSAVSTTVSPATSTNLLLTSPTISSKMSGSAVVNSKLVFNSSSPVPSESLVLHAARTLLSSRLTNLSDSTKVLNITYEKKTDISYALLFTFSLSNISMPESADLRNNTYVQVQNSINKALNTLLNDRNAEPFEPKSSVFTTSANQVEGSMEYSFQEGDTKQPVSFLNELKMQSAVSTTVSPATTTNLMLTSPTISSKMSGSAVVNSKLVFNSSSPVPSESLVLHAARTLLSSRLTNLSDSTKVLNITYEKKTDISYALLFTFSLSNISMPESADLRNNTYVQVQNSINKALNTLLNDRNAEPFEPKSSVFTTSANQVEGSMEYSFQEGDTKQPVSFLSELKMQSAVSTTVSPATTTNLMLTSPTISSKISGSAVVNSKLVFNSSSPVPSESLVLHAARTLLSSRLTNLSDSTKVLNITYEKKTDTSYALLFTFSLSNISMPESADLRNNTYVQVQNSINKALNTLLNDRNAEPFEPKSSVFTTSANQVEGSMEYSFQEGDTKQPVSFLSELKMQSAVSTTVSPATTTNLLLTSPTISSKMSGSAVVNSKLVFNSSSPVPSESLVLHAARTLLSSRLTNLSDSTKVLNITYEKKTDTSYALLFTFSLSNISMPESADLRNNTYVQVQNSINKALNTLLNDRNAEPFEPKSSVFTTSANQVEGSMEYSFQEGDTKQPVSFLSELKMQSAVSTTVSPATTTNLLLTSPTISSKMSGSAVVNSKLVFNSSSPVPSESLVLHAARTLLSSRLTNLSDSTKVLNITYEKKTDTSFVVIFIFSLSNISMPESMDLRNNTYIQVQNSVNIALNTILTDPGNDPFNPQIANFTSTSNQILGDMVYSFQEDDINKPTSFLRLLSNAYVLTTTKTPNISTTRTPTLQTMTSSTLMGTVLIYIRLVFKNLTSLPSEAEVLNAASTLLDASVRMKRDVRMQKLNNPVSIQNVTYQKTGNNSYTITFGFKISYVNISSNLQLRNETYDSIQNTVNMLLNKILNGKSSTPFNFPRANYTGNDTVIQAVSEYVFVEGDIQAPSGFLAEILKVSGLASTTAQPTVPNTTIPGNSTGGFPGWALAIIIPCSIAIILIPTWITLGCMLCGCCAAIRRRYSRRRSYNVQYTTRNGLF